MANNLVWVLWPCNRVVCILNDLYVVSNERWVLYQWYQWKVEAKWPSVEKLLLFSDHNPQLYILTKSVFLISSCDQAALQMVQSVRLSVCPSVCPSHLFDYVRIIVSSWNFQELLPMTKVMSMQKVKVRGQRSRSQRSQRNLTVSDCNSSLNWHMMMKWYMWLDVA